MEQKLGSYLEGWEANNPGGLGCPVSGLIICIDGKMLYSTNSATTPSQCLLHKSHGQIHGLYVLYRPRYDFSLTDGSVVMQAVLTLEYVYTTGYKGAL